MLPSLPSRVTWETSDFSVGTVRLRVWKSTSPVEPTGSKRLIIGRRRSRRLPLLPDDRVPHRLGGEHPRFRDRHQIPEAVAAGRPPLLDPRAAHLDQPGEEPGRPVVDGVEVGVEERLARAKATCCGRTASGRPPRARVADDAAHLDPARHRVRTDLELGRVVEVEPDLVVGELDAVAVEPRELDPQLSRPSTAQTSIPGFGGSGSLIGLSEEMNWNGMP